MHRGTTKAKDAVDTGMKVLARGGVIAIFPEGTLTRDPDLWPMVARTGAARMALETGVPVVPGRAVGRAPPPRPLQQGPQAHSRARRSPSWPGRAIDLDDLARAPIDNEMLREATDRIMDTLTRMVEEMRGETAPAVRYDMRKKGA